MKLALAITLATFHGWWTFAVPHTHLRWRAYVRYRHEFVSAKTGYLKHRAGTVEVVDLGAPSGVEMTIRNAQGCYRFMLPATFTKPKRAMAGTVGPCEDDSATTAFVGRRR
jgi:hypothetical protein